MHEILVFKISTSIIAKLEEPMIIGLSVSKRFGVIARLYNDLSNGGAL